MTKWTIEKIQKEAMKYKTKSEFRRGNKSAYNAASRMKSISVVCSHMPEYAPCRIPSNVKWTIESLATEAKKHTTRTEFGKKSGGAWNAAKRLGVLDIITSHIPEYVDVTKENNPSFFLSKGIKVLHINEKNWLCDKIDCVKKCLEFLQADQ